jgi:hypothetical protein
VASQGRVKNIKRKLTSVNLALEATLLTSEEIVINIDQPNISPLDRGQPSYFIIPNLPKGRAKLIFDVIECIDTINFMSASKLSHLKNKAFDINFHREYINDYRYLASLNKSQDIENIHFLLKNPTNSDITDQILVNFRVNSFSEDAPNPYELFEAPTNLNVWDSEEKLTIQSGVF